MNLTKTSTILFAAFFALNASAAVQADSLGTSAVISNVVPVVEAVTVSSSVSPVAGGVVSVPVAIDARDNNGHQDLVSVSVQVSGPSGVHTATAPATSNEDGSGTAQTYVFSFDMAFHDEPGTYTVTATAQDQTGAASAAASSTFTYEALAALDLDTSSVAFGSVDPDTSSAVKSVTVQNFGNVLIDLQSNGTGLDDGAGHTIAASNIKYDLAHSNMSMAQSLTETVFTNTGFDLTTGPSSTQTTYWRLDVPSGDEQYLPAGTYSGSITLSAVQG